MPSYGIATPCSASWDSMPGDQRVRHCPQCNLDVYNFSAMTPPEISQLIRSRTGRLCARFYQRADGTMLTRDCPVAAPSPLPNTPLLATATLAALVSIIPVRVSAVPQWSTPALLQPHAAEEVLSIVVRDPAGGLVPDSAISLVNTRTNQRFDGRTTETGDFYVANLPNGTYDLTITHAGFATFVQKGIAIPAHLTVTLQLGALMGDVVIVRDPLTVADPPTAALSEPSEPLNSPALPSLRPADRPNFFQRFFSRLHRALR